MVDAPAPPVGPSEAVPVTGTVPDAPVAPVETSADTQPRREGLARLTVHTMRTRGQGTAQKTVRISTHVSLDALLFSLLAVRLGGERAVTRWAQGVVDEVDQLKAEDRVAPPRDVDASLSRLVQRAGLRLLWGGWSV